jgi:hypothetical protein
MRAVGVVDGRESLDDALELKNPVAASPATHATPSGASHRRAG